MPYMYRPDKDYWGAVFNRAPGYYPTIELPVAQFADPDHERRYQGSSALANLIIRRAMDHPDARPKSGEDVPTLLATNDLYIAAHFDNRQGTIIESCLQVFEGEVLLMGGAQLGRSNMKWRRQLDGSTRVEAVMQEDAALPGSQHPLGVGWQEYDHLPTQTEFQHNPALRYDTAFRDVEKRLWEIPFRRGPTNLRVMIESVAEAIRGNQP